MEWTLDNHSMVVVRVQDEEKFHCSRVPLNAGPTNKILRAGWSLGDSRTRPPH